MGKSAERLKTLPWTSWRSTWPASSVVKRKWFIAKVTLAVTLLAILVVLFGHHVPIPPKPAFFRPEQGQSLSAALMGQLGSVAALAGKDLGLKNPSDAYVLVLQSNAIGKALAHRFDLSRVYRTRHERVDTIKALARSYRRSKMTFKSGVITVEFDDKDPNRAAGVANAYIQELQHVMQTLSVTEASQRRAFFEQQVRDAKLQLAGSEAELKGVEEKTGLIQLDSQAKAIIQEIANVREQIAARRESGCRACGAMPPPTTRTCSVLKES